MDTPVGVLCLYPWCMFAAPARKCMVMFIYICIYIHSPQMVMLTFSCLGFQLKRSMYDYKYAWGRDFPGCKDFVSVV